jgi:colanic acid/amylovoran biosynthesis glycosyltransferase
MRDGLMAAQARRLVVVTSRYPFGSQEAYLQTELAELRRHLDRIAVMPVRPPKSPAQHRVPENVDVISWSLFSAPLLRRAVRTLLRRPARTVRTLAPLIASRDPGRAKNLTVALKALALADWAIENDIDHIHAYWASTPATVAMIAAGVSGIAWSCTAHRWDIYERNAFDAKAKSVSFVRTISTRGTTDLARRMPGVAGRIVELRLGTAVPAAPVFARRAREPFRVICPAALVAVKGHDELLRALARLRAWGVEVRCTLAGVGPRRGELEGLVALLGLGEVVEFAGFLPQQTLHEWYRMGRFAAVVLASRADGERAMEGIPSALIEAMAFGVPVVATDSGSVPELLDDRVGRLVKTGDVNALACALLDVYLDPAAAKVRAQRAHQRVATQYDASTQMQKLAAAFNKRNNA